MAKSLHHFIDHEKRMEAHPVVGRWTEQAVYMPHGYDHPMAHVTYLPEGSTHDHTILLGGADDIEGIAEELSEKVLICNESRHQGHGQTHSGFAAEEAYRFAVWQMQNIDWWEWWYQEMLKRDHYELWGNKHPAEIVIEPNPSNPNKESLLYLKHPLTGIPSRYVIPNVLDIPEPDMNKYKLTEYGYRYKGAIRKDRTERRRLDG